MRRIYNFNDLKIGDFYKVKCGIWELNYVVYCGHVHSSKKYTFTCGTTPDSWVDNFNIVASKSNLKVYKYCEGED